MIDIGGTKINAWVASQTAHPAITLKTQRGIPALSKQLDQLLRQFNTNTIAGVHIAIPGKLIGKNNAIIAPHTAQQLGAFPGEMDNFDVQHWIETLLSQCAPSASKYKITIENDAIFQMKWRLADYGLEKLSGKTILYIGPGTGLGGGLCHVSNCKVTVYGDGHIYDIMLKNPLTGQYVIAEDLISGRAIETQTGHSAKDIAESPQLWQKFERELFAMRDSFIDLVKKLQSGQFEKRNKKENWPADICQHAMSIDALIVGGSLGVNKPFSDLFEHPLRLN